MPGRFAAYRLQTFFCLLITLVENDIYAICQQPDTTLVLKEIEVKAPTSKTALTATDGSVTYDASAMTNAPRAFGEADALHYLQYVAGINSISDYSSGASIDGMDYSQNTFRLNGVPVQFPYHFGGIFSTFNSDHFPRMTVRRSVHPAGSPNCLGGIIDAYSRNNIDRHRVRGSVNIGMLASSAHISLPICDKLSVEASGRVSYIDAMYHGLISSEHTNISYNLHDIDFSAEYHPSPADRITATFHHNGDRLDYDDDNYAMNTGMHWHNTLAGIGWHRASTHLQAYFTEMSNTLDLSMVQFSLKVPSKISQYGMTGEHTIDHGRLHCRAGSSVEWTRNVPQWVRPEGIGDGNYAPERVMNAFSSKLFAEAGVNVSDNIRITAGLDANYFKGYGNYSCIDIDPRLTASWQSADIAFSAHAGRTHQYIHQTGFSEIGLSSNFKLAASVECPAQEAWNFVLTASRNIPFDVTLDLEAYYKLLSEQPEYVGAVLDLLDTDYHAENYVLSCEGYNIGANINLRRSFRELTAMINYSYGIARRRAPGANSYFTASSDIRHSLSAVSAYEFNDGQWSVNAAFNLASGRPVTPVQSIYMVAERVMLEYGVTNSARLPLYHRLDIGANYRFSTGGKQRLRHCVSVSILNVYGRKNVEISTYTFDVDRGSFVRRNVYSMYRFLPSLSYRIEF